MGELRVYHGQHLLSRWRRHASGTACSTKASAPETRGTRAPEALVEADACGVHGDAEGVIWCRIWLWQIPRWIFVQHNWDFRSVLATDHVPAEIRTLHRYQGDVRSEGRTRNDNF